MQRHAGRHMTHPTDSTESAEARANEPARRWEVMRLERIGWRLMSDAEYADPDRRAEMMRDAKQAVDVLNRLSSGRQSPRILAEAARELDCSVKTKPEPSPDGPRTPAEAARKLRCSIKTLNAHVAAGDLCYVIIGKGTKRPRRMYVAADLDAFIANQTRKDVPCPPTSQKMAARRISTTTSKCEVIGFTARRNARRAAKPKK